MSDSMRLSLAPLEGLTGHVMRRVHRRLYPGTDRYYTPFLSPIDPPGLTPRALSEVARENNVGIPLVPQLLTNRVDHFLAAAHTLAELGYEEVNLNLGCPSGTVVAKGKASGMLCDPDSVDRLLDGIFSSCPIAVSVKTRVGRFSAEEIVPLMEVYNRYPLAELIVHPRIRNQMYRGSVDLDAFDHVMRTARMPVCYNGDLFSPSDVARIRSAYPSLSSLMLGRGVIANPGLICEVKGSPRTSRATLRAYHDELLADTADLLSGDRHVIRRMKEYWFYLICLFENAEHYGKQLRKSNTMAEYLAAVGAIFDSCPIGRDAAFLPPSV